ncbi:hypothetical protein [Neobacillus terrae]|uniref:hypothetical protein n=1 Tax=Neobacillus terrae TaxID=3034837 RepID=UPI001409ACC8|nr:hypothetical protein [Neobacillus terrae]NHM33989.1 hypothetical protein [Neobacillus terrae]
MFKIVDIIQFLISFFLIFPMVNFIHLCGHIFFATIFGGIEKKIVIGCGNKLFSIWRIELRKYYFWNGSCEFSSLKYDNRWTNTFIYLGGAIFNLLSMFFVNTLIYQGILNFSVFWKQFIYFSFYVLFFSIFPMSFSDGSPSDGKAVVLSVKKQHKDKITGDIQIKSKK